MELVIFILGVIGLSWCESYFRPRIAQWHGITVLEYNGEKGRKRIILW